MTEQKKKINTSVKFIKDRFKLNEFVHTAVICYSDSYLIKDFKAIKKISYKDIPPVIEAADFKNDGELILASGDKKKLFIMNGRFNFYHGYSMRDCVHLVYVLRAMGVRNIIMIDEVGTLNARYNTGEVALIYDHINFMGTNPLIGENDNTIGPRFPDMSNAYDEGLYKKAEKIIIENSFKFHPSIYIGVTGPETETEAECRFFREAGSDIVGYSLVPENLAAVHCGMKCLAFGIITRELIPDRFGETSKEKMMISRTKAEKSFSKILAGIINSI